MNIGFATANNSKNTKNTWQIILDNNLLKKNIMKTAILLISITVLFCGIGCKKCVTCTESVSSYSQEYCGTPPQVKAFENELQNLAPSTQHWTCN